MGGGPETEVLLMIFHGPEPQKITDHIRQKFPHIEVIYYELPPPTTDKQIGGIPYSDVTAPDELWHKATILVTLSSLPAKRELVPNLKLVHILSAGVDHLINSHWIFTDSDLPVTTVSGVTGPPIAEWVLMTVLDLSKNYNILHENQMRKRWDSPGSRLMSLPDWHGKTVGVLGYGSIGRQVARVFSALGSKIHAYTASPRSTPESRKDTGYVMPNAGDPDGVIPEAWYSGGSYTGLHTFLASGLDLVVICVPLTESTRGLIGKEEFEVLYRTSLEKVRQRLSNPDISDLPEGDGCILTNISRGAVVKTDALVTALKEKKLLGATLDVTEPEPLPNNSELWTMDNVVITPHISGLGRDYVHRGFDVLEMNLKRREKGEKLVNEVNRKKGY